MIQLSKKELKARIAAATSTNDEVISSSQTIAKPTVSRPLHLQELIKMLKECRDLLVMCTLIDKSGHCKSLVDKVDTKMGWQ